MSNLPKVGVGVLVFNNKEEILLSQRLNAHGHNSYGPPGGHLELFEEFEDCAIREVKEEAGLDIENPEFIAVTNDIFKEEEKHYISIFMKSEYKGCEVKNVEPAFAGDWGWYSLDSLPEHLFLPLNQLVEGKCYGKKIIN